MEKKIDQSLNLVVKSSVIVLIGVLVSKLSIYAYRVIIARSFGPEVYGLFSLAIMISSWFVVVSTLGLNQGLLRYIPFYRAKDEIEKIRYIIRFNFYTILISSTLAGVLLFGLSNYIAINIFHQTNLIIFLKLFGIATPIIALSGHFIAQIRAFEMIGWYSFVYNIVQNVLKLILILILIFIGIKSYSVAISYVLGTLGTLVAAYLVCKYKLSEMFYKSKLKKSSGKNLSNSMVLYSLPVMMFGVISAIFFWIDSFFIGYFKTASDVGIYNVAAAIATLLLIFPEIFTQLFFPLINRDYSNKNYYKIQEISKQVGKWIFIINLPIFLLFIIFPGAFINLLFGSSYLLAEQSLRILSLAMLISSMGYISNQLILVAGKSKAIMFDIILASVINILLNILLIPEYGINGAATSTLLSIFFLNVLFVIQAKHYISVIPFRRKMLNILIISIIPTAVMLYLKNFLNLNFLTMFFLITLFFLSYVLLIFLTKSFDRNDIAVFKNFISKFYKKL